MPDPRLPYTAYAPDAGDAEANVHGRCVRCGRPTPPGVSLCEDDNPGHLGAPSSTQAHGTIVAGVGIGILVLAVAAKLLTAGVGPFAATIVGEQTRPGGAVLVAFTVTNTGTRAGAATCHLTNGAVARPEDPLFLTPSIPAGGSASFEKTVLPPDPSTVIGETPTPIRVTCQ
jgi:hypothetical protein